MYARRLLSLAGGLALSAGFVAASCGGGDDDPFCGDGIHQPEIGEQCDDGNLDDTDNCRNNCTTNLPGVTTIGWAFNKDPAPMFTNDSCTDLRVITVEVTVDGPVTETMSDSCSLRQVVFQGIPAGTYTVRVKPLDINGDLMIDAPIELSTDLGPGTMIEIDVPPDRWLRSYTGTFFFRILWGGQDCDDASPPVTQHRLTLEQGGSPVSVTTENGDPLDGSGPGACQLFSAEFPQSALMVPFGAATFTIEGLDSGGTPQFRESFDTFVGAGISNPELHFDVNSLAPDAGVPDAGPDGGPGPDAL
jgi:cysteine-rich repeat protein